MNTQRLIVVSGLLIACLVLSSCGSGPMPTPLPTTADEELSAKDMAIADFNAVHAPINGDTNEYVIFGHVPVSPSAADLAPELAGLLGRWEGYDYSPPVRKDYKLVLVIQEITAQEGKAALWLGTNLQYPSAIQEIRFKVVSGATPSIQFAAELNRSKTILTLAYDRDRHLLRSPVGTGRSLELSRDRSFHVYKDYAQYLASKRITFHAYRTTVLSRYGRGYLLYLPEGYETQPDKTWPLIFFLHGSGDRGDNPFLLAKASPFMMIREKGSLPFIIVAPLLSASPDYTVFPDNYLTGVLEEVVADYRVDQTRIYVTGLSLGGEAAYRFALLRPETFAAIAPLSAFVYSPSQMERIKDLPVWAIHGADDTIIPLARAQKPVDALKQVGGHVQFTILQNHDHDTWTDTYSDPKFYEWLLQHHRP